MRAADISLWWIKAIEFVSLPKICKIISDYQRWQPVRPVAISLQSHAALHENIFFLLEAISGRESMKWKFFNLALGGGGRIEVALIPKVAAGAANVRRSEIEKNCPLIKR